MTWGTIIVVIIALWGVISQVLEAAAKKAKEKKRQEELKLRASRELGVTMERPVQSGETFRMQAQEPEGGHPGHIAEVRTPSTMTEPTPYRPVRVQQTRGAQQSRVAQQSRAGGESDLAARRRAQLEQLRQRRGAIDPRSQGIATRTGGTVQQPAPPLPTSFQPGRRPAGPKPAQRRPARPGGIQAGAPTPPRKGKAAGRAAGPISAEGTGQVGQIEDLIASMEKRPQPVQDAYSMPTFTHSVAGSWAGTSRAAGPNADALRALLGSPASLRQIFLAKELLDPPVSLRTDPEHGYLSG